MITIHAVSDIPTWLCQFVPEDISEAIRPTIKPHKTDLNISCFQVPDEMLSRLFRYLRLQAYLAIKIGYEKVNQDPNEKGAVYLDTARTCEELMVMIFMYESKNPGPKGEYAHLWENDVLPVAK